MLRGNKKFEGFFGFPIKLIGSIIIEPNFVYDLDMVNLESYIHFYDPDNRWLALYEKEARVIFPTSGAKTALYQVSFQSDDIKNKQSCPQEHLSNCQSDLDLFLYVEKY